MYTYNNIANELKTFFCGHPFFKAILPLDAVMIFGGLGIIFLSSLFGFGMSALLPQIAYYAFLLGIVLAYANYHNIFVYSGLFSYGAIQILTLLKSMIIGRVFSWNSLFAGLIFLLLGYVALKESNSCITKTH